MPVIEAYCRVQLDVDYMPHRFVPESTVRELAEDVGAPMALNVSAATMKAHTCPASAWIVLVTQSSDGKRALRTHVLNVTHYFPRGMPRGKGVTYASHSPSTQALEHTTLHSLTQLILIGLVSSVWLPVWRRMESLAAVLHTLCLFSFPRGGCESFFSSFTG